MNAGSESLKKKMMTLSQKILYRNVHLFPSRVEFRFGFIKDDRNSLAIKQLFIFNFKTPFVKIKVFRV